MSDFDDVIDMGELASKLGSGGELPPELTATAEPTAPVAADPVRTVEPEQHDFVGGLEGTPGIDTGHDDVLDLDALLGLKKAEPEEPREPSGPDAPESSAPRPGSLDERMAELAERARKAEEQRDKLIARLISEGGGTPQSEETPPAGSELIPETKAFLYPYVEARAREIAEEMVAPLRQDLAPVIEKERDRRLAATISKFVPGLTAEHMPVLHEAFDSITDPELKAVYGGGVAGAAALAHDLVRRGALDLVNGAPRPRVNPLTSRHHTEGGGPRSATGADANDEDAQVKALMNLSGDKLLAALARKFPDL
jgi:hypothetical protein